MQLKPSNQAEPPRPALFSPLPTHGIWSAADLTRGQFSLILVLSVLLFVFVGGPIWLHARESHFWRINISYAAIVPAVALALWQNRKLQLAQWIVGTALISIAKLVITAVILVVVGVAR